MIKIKTEDIIKTITFILWNRLFREFTTLVVNEYMFNIYCVSSSLILFLYLICMALVCIFKYNISFKNATGYFSLLYNIFIVYFGLY